MAKAVGPAPHGLIVELGPGTGPVTSALIERGLGEQRLALVEYDAAFCRLLKQRFAQAKIIQGDAYDLPNTLKELGGKPIAAIVSSLPLLNQPPDRREKLIGDAFDLMGRQGVFVQFTYGSCPPFLATHAPTATRRFAARRFWRNLPPARVWTYRLGAGEADRTDNRKRSAHASGDR